LAILANTSQAIIASLVPDQVYASIHQAATQLMPTEYFLIALLDGAEPEVAPVYLVERGERVEAGRLSQANGLCGYVIATGESLMMDDRNRPGELQLTQMEIPGQPRSTLAVPIRLGEKVVGMLASQSDRPNAYTRDDLQALSTLANQAAIAIENAKLFEETQRSLRETTFLSQIIAITATESDLVTALHKVCSELAVFFRVPEVSFVLFNAQFTSGQVVAEFHDTDRPGTLGLQVSMLGNPAIDYLLRSATTLAIPDVVVDPLIKPLRELVYRRGIQSLLLVPIVFGGQVIGFLEIDHLRRRYFESAEISLVEKVASQVSQVLERLGLFAATREQAERMAQLASLSEALNRPLSEAEVVSSIGQAGKELGSADRAAIYFFYRDGRLAVPWASGLSEEYLEQVTSHVHEIPGGSLLQSPEPVLISDLEALPETALLRGLGLKEGYRAVELWPLVYEDQVIAAIGCYYNQPHPWSDVEQEVMLAFARQAAVALQNARLFDETRRRAAHLEALNAIIAAAPAATDLQNLLESALDRTLRALGLQIGGIWAAGQHVLRDVPPEIEKAGAGIPREARLDTLGTVMVPDWEEAVVDEALAPYATAMRATGLRASLTVPILLEGRRIGGLSVISRCPRSWLLEEIELIEGVGRQIGGAVRRLELLEKIQGQARQVEQIMDAVPEGVLLLDENRRIILANPAAQAYLRELAGLQVGDALADLGGRPVYDLLRADTNTIWYELEIQGPPRRIFELGVQPLEGGDYSGGWVLVLRDVTQERENQAHIQMQDRLATVGQLAAGIAHDFNNIMAAIIVYADLLKRDPNLLPSSQERLGIIQQQVERAASLIRQILDFSRRSVMEQSTLDLLPFVKELDHLLRRVMPETIRLELIYQPGVYLVNADPTRLQQVFMNLAVNARDASPNGGSLHFKLDRVVVRAGERPPCPELPSGDWVRISVQDTGEGIPAEILPHIFEPFFTTKPVGKGTGLGLAQAYGIIKQHDGHIDVHSQVGAGTTFHIYLRAQNPLKEADTSPRPAAELKGGGELLLVVEDDPAARDAMRALLEDYNYQVLMASNGAEALEIFDLRAGSIRLVVSDVVMPVMGGVELYQALRERWPQLKVLFVTGHPIREQDQQILQKGKVHWLQKPFPVLEFSQAVYNLLSDGIGGEEGAG
jgi:GAF domain-containing protein/ActR/RegA family two-component response regulator